MGVERRSERREVDDARAILEVAAQLAEEGEICWAIEMVSQLVEKPLPSKSVKMQSWTLLTDLLEQLSVLQAAEQAYGITSFLDRFDLDLEDDYHEYPVSEIRPRNEIGGLSNQQTQYPPSDRSSIPSRIGDMFRSSTRLNFLPDDSESQDQSAVYDVLAESTNSSAGTNSGASSTSDGQSELSEQDDLVPQCAICCQRLSKLRFWRHKQCSACDKTVCVDDFRRTSGYCIECERVNRSCEANQETSVSDLLDGLVFVKDATVVEDYFEKQQCGNQEGGYSSDVPLDGHLLDHSMIVDYFTCREHGEHITSSASVREKNCDSSSSCWAYSEGGCISSSHALGSGSDNSVVIMEDFVHRRLADDSEPTPSVKLATRASAVWHNLFGQRHVRVRSHGRSRGYRDNQGT